jgi:hypothetical protein
MEKLMKNNMMKLVVCTGIFCGTSFGMEKEQAISGVVQNKLYVEYCDVFQRINQDGSYSNVEDSTESIIRSSKRFNKGHFLTFNNQKYCVQGDFNYAISVALKKGGIERIDLNLENSYLAPLQCTNDQLKEVVRLIEVRNGLIDLIEIKDGKVHYKDGKQYNLFVLDEYNFRLDIESVAFDIEEMVRELKDDVVKKETNNSELAKK